MPEKIKLIALDLDGTLALKDHKISPATRNALTQLHNDGIEVVISTGRRFRTAQYVIDNLDFETYCICNGGALVKDPQKVTVLDSTFSKQEFTIITTLARKYDLAIAAQRDAHTIGGPDFIIDNAVEWHSGISSYYKNNLDYAHGADLLKLDEQNNYLALATFDKESKLEGFVSELEKDNRFNVTVVTQFGGDAHYCEVTQRHVDKWYGLRHVAEVFGLQVNNICAVGDELNDLSMVGAAGLGVAMGNAHDKLKSISDFICGSNEDDGLLELFDYIRAHNEGIT
ncbi:MAG: HAD family phosphatase [Pseudomonadales bacterium]|nr:HAD family phosphatase [Pseudomonadales bacterium]